MLNERTQIRISVLVSLYRGSSYLEGFFDALNGILNPDVLEIIIIHNDPEEDELEIIRRCKQTCRCKIMHVNVKHRESLYSSWNRGIKLATGRYITIWNVDDVRLPDSLERQAQILDNYSGVSFTYGDQVEIQTYGETDGVLVCFPEFHENPELFLSGFHIGSFPMWRKALHDVAGYFDEQFKSAGDFDFFIRVARNFSGKKVTGVLGYYLASKGISKTGSVNNIERTLVELRYAQYQKLNYVYLLPAIIRYRIKTIKSYGMKHKVGQYFQYYPHYILKRLYTFPIGLLLFPFQHLFPMIRRKISHYA